eukprot:2993271-Rhodomonas_salina.1
MMLRTPYKASDTDTGRGTTRRSQRCSALPSSRTGMRSIVQICTRSIIRICTTYAMRSAIKTCTRIVQSSTLHATRSAIPAAIRARRFLYATRGYHSAYLTGCVVHQGCYSGYTRRASQWCST